MRDFVYFTPTKVLFGAEAECRTGAVLQSYGCKKVLIHYGGKSALANGLLNRIIRSVADAGIAYAVLGGVVPNPRLSKVTEGIALCRREQVDFILAVGGGSVIDSAKAIAYGLAATCDVWDFFSGKAQPQGSFPVGCVLTIAAAGSEMSNSCVITNDSNGLKRACDNEFGRCRFAIMNPSLTMTLPQYQTQCGCADILMHTMERYFHRGGTLELTDALSEALMKNVMRYARVLLSEPDNLQARAEIMWAGSLSHNGLTGCGGGNGDWATHLIEHELGGMFDVAHGAGLTAVWGSWARYVCGAAPARFIRFATEVMDVDATGQSEEAVIEAGISAMEAFFAEIGMPTSLEALGLSRVDDSVIEVLSAQCTDNGQKQIGDVLPLNAQDVKKIYSAALKSR